MKKVLALALAFACSTAFATASTQGCTSSNGQAAGCTITPTTNTVNQGGQGGKATGVGVGIGVSKSTNTNSNTNSNLNANSNRVSNRVSNAATGGSVGNVSATGGQGGSGGAGGTGVSSAGAQSAATANNSGNNQSLTISNAAAPSDVKLTTVGQAPDVLTNATAPCRIAVGGSIGLMGGAAGFSTSILDEGCDINRLSAQFKFLGMEKQARLAMCFDKKAKELMGAECDGIPAEPKKTPEAAPVNPGS